jgi:hypothetical protein
MNDQIFCLADVRIVNRILMAYKLIDSISYKLILEGLSNKKQVGINFNHLICFFTHNWF